MTEVKTLYTEAIMERATAKRVNQRETVVLAESLVALIDELIERKWLTWDDNEKKITELHNRLKNNPAANARTNEALQRRIELNKKKWG